jgi:fumarate reductase flavoprotein subunit
MKKRAMVASLALAAILALGSCSGNKNKSGSFSASAPGVGGEVNVTVKLAEGKITAVEVGKNNETVGIADGALVNVPKAIVDNQSITVDVVAGATITSNAIMKATEAALTKAGVDVAEFRRPVTVAAAKAADINMTADVVVIGAGGAGLAAAVQANQNGASVIVLEKMPRAGGNAILSGGAMNAVEEGSAIAVANKDSVALHYKQTFEGGDKLADPALVKTFTDNAWSAVAWLKSLGMAFTGEVFTVAGGLWPRAHRPADPVGTGFFKTYSAYIDSHNNINVLFNAKAEHLIVENGRVVGVIGAGTSGNSITVRASKGVVLATGGFGQNIEMRERFNKQWPTLGASVLSTNHPGATGDGIAMAEEVGAQLLQMENIQLLPLGDPKTGSLSGNIEHGVETRIFVNKEGKRFVDEGGRRDVMTLGLYKQPDNLMWIVMDADTYPNGSVENNFHETIDELVTAGRTVKANTLDELAQKMDVNADNLKAAVADFNAHAATKTPDAFGRTLYDTPIDTPPFYAGARIPTVHHTMGGVKIDPETHVISVSGQVIPGLYAAGEVTGGIHGTNRLGGNALTDMTVFGRIAGANAAAGK